MLAGGRTWVGKAPAKINLWLEVIRKREDGYHDISSLMLPISVYDHIEIEGRPGDGPITIDCASPKIPDEPVIPSDERNLAWRAAELYMKASGIKAGIHIDLKKDIPSGAGLGGGSSDAAGVLAGLNTLFENAVSFADLERLAAGLGADVPFFLHRRAALATGIGENLQPVDIVPGSPLLLIKPPVSVPTGWVYRNLKLTKGSPQIKLVCSGHGPWQLTDLVDRIQNDLESVTVPRYPVISEIKDYLIARGALAACMSGSGSTVFGIFETEQAAKEAAIFAEKDWPPVFWVRAAVVTNSS
jgi:4-diphosphocytidyl-2-C-methyl-D-erythritol kinase